ncbi:hypothetical protein C7475_101734 [Chitinophaga sp. S165]|nr:hypothetical protein C7475_101734 [Chitinophaga sp. S165]
MPVFHWVITTADNKNFITLVGEAFIFEEQLRHYSLDFSVIMLLGKPVSYMFITTADKEKPIAALNYLNSLP